MLEREIDGDELAAWEAGAPEQLDALGLDAVLAAELTSTLREPAVELALVLRRGGERRRLTGRLGTMAALIAEPPAAGEPSLLLLGSLLELPRLLAELVDLGPRPGGDDGRQLPIPREVLEAYCGVGLSDAAHADLRETLSDVLEIEPLEALLGPATLRWTLTLTFAGGERTVIDVADAGDGGLWSLDDVERLAGDGDALTPALATTIAPGVLWAMLAAIPAATAAAAQARVVA